MNIQNWLQSATNQLSEAGVESARLDCLILLGDALGKDRAWILANPEYIIGNAQLNTLNDQIKRRFSHEPIAYIRGCSEFYGREFSVSAATLQPRPESETIISTLISHVRSAYEGIMQYATTIYDIGTGSGCLAITAKLELPHTEVYATDISPEALAIAKQNSRKLNANLKILQGNLLSPFKDQISNNKYLVILANLPYVPETYELNTDATHEPDLAIFGGNDGLDLYRQMFAQMLEYGIKPNVILTESLSFQHNELAQIASRHGYALTQTIDLIQKFEPLSN